MSLVYLNTDSYLSETQGHYSCAQVIMSKLFRWFLVSDEEGCIDKISVLDDLWSAHCQGLF